MLRGKILRICCFLFRERSHEKKLDVPVALQIQAQLYLACLKIPPQIARVRESLLPIPAKALLIAVFSHEKEIHLYLRLL
jgi:hypothetical protein